MHLHFSSGFDSDVHLPAAACRANVLYAGPKKLLHWLEEQFGLSGYPENTDYLRIELYRQALQQRLETGEYPCFYQASFEADRFATAEALLAWRDELLLSGWTFVADAPDCPERLAVLAGVEQVFAKKIQNPEAGSAAMGVADRVVNVFKWLESRGSGIETVFLYEPEDLLPPVARRYVAYFRQKNTVVEVIPAEASAAADTDLGWLQHSLLQQVSGKKTAGNDGSLLLLTARRDSDAAVFLAQWLAKNPDWHPVFLIPELNRVLEQAFLLEGLPALGVLSASLARPSLQVLKLAPAFLWEPVDVFKLMEFVTLPVKPLDEGLALEIARVLAEKPGLNSDTWYAAVLGYLDQEPTPASIREQYEFWFNRRRYRAEGTAPKRDALEMYNYLHRWAREQFDGTKNTTFLVLAEQARRVRDLLDALPEQRLGFLELERIVRTIYEPAPVQLTPAETGRFEFVHQPGGVAAPVDALVWWNCLFDARTPPVERWQHTERQWLLDRQVWLDDPLREGKCRQWLSQRPVLQARRRLVLCIPQQADGADALPSLLLSDIEAAFENTRGFTFCLDDASDVAALERFGPAPGATHLSTRIVDRPRPLLTIPRPDRLLDSAYETPTQLENLFYYPHRWFFRQKLRLFPASLLSVTRDQTLLGSLAHRFFELLLQEDCLGWPKTAVHDWVEAKASTLLEREGATLLLYGREPERNQFLNRVKNAAWSLLSLLRANGWSIVETELPLQGTFGGFEVRGKADLVLRREPDEWAIVDLKWSGARRRREMIRNGEDLQLVLYAKLLPPEEHWAHTAYFILEDGKMIARNKEAFRDAIVAGADADHREVCTQIIARMERTFQWRMEQIRQGRLELRTARTAAELDALYAEQLIDLLEMKTEDSRWDDYRTLLDFMG